jgi:hypothetical protein
MTALDRHRLLVIERDDDQGAQAQQKKIYLFDLRDNRILIANDNNYPGSNGRWVARNRPDDTEMIVLSVPSLGTHLGEVTAG